MKKKTIRWGWVKKGGKRRGGCKGGTGALPNFQLNTVVVYHS